MMKLICAFAGALMDLIYPRKANCMACGSRLGNDRKDVCEDCRAELIRDWVGPRMMGSKLLIDGAAFAHHYRGAGGALVRKLKYGGVWVLAEPMGEAIARAVKQLQVAHPSVCTFVPMHPKRELQRGANHAELLARSVSSAMQIELLDVLERTRDAAQQAKLDAASRRRNLKDAFAVKAGYAACVRGREVLIVDDVFTTGATCKACADALRKAGASRVWFGAYCIGGQDKKHG